MENELKQFDKVIKTEDMMGVSCDGITCKCKNLNIEENKDQE